MKLEIFSLKYNNEFHELKKEGVGIRNYMEVSSETQLISKCCSLYDLVEDEDTCTSYYSYFRFCKMYLFPPFSVFMC